MSGLIEKVKEKVRGRSRSNSRRSIRDGPRQSGDYSRYDGRASQDLVHSSSPQTSSPTNPAWHVSKGARTSTDGTAAPPVPSVDPRYNNEVSHVHPNGSDPSSHSNRYTINNSNAAAGDHLGHSTSTHQTQQQYATNSQDTSQGSAAYPYTVPRRKESLANKSQNRTSVDNNRLSQNFSDSQHTSRLSGSHTQHEKDLPPPPTMSNDLGTDIDQALADLSVNNRHSQNSTSTRAGEGFDEHLRLPKGFKIGHRETTSVDTQWMPAVTHEKIHHQRTEVLREAITKDIHVHHYYTYVQPVRVVEVLPTRHYRLDEKTGRKIEIAAPAGWELPADMRPRTETLGPLKGYHRHYLVDEQNPNGIPEAAPAGYDTDGVDGPLHVGQHVGRSSNEHVMSSSRHGF